VIRPLVEVHNVSKRFGGVQAVADVSITIGRGSIHGLVGENGAGKSTLAKIIGGVHQPDSGELMVDGEPRRFTSPRGALAVGIASIAQEIALVPARTVLENVFLGIESTMLGVVQQGRLIRRYVELVRRTGFELKPDDRVRELRTADQQKVEILRAIARNARLILMDEPTASLTLDESDRLLDIIRRLAAGGTSVVLVSHNLKEVLAVAGTVTVMRDGKIVRTGPASQETPHSLVTAMIGRELELTFPPKNPPPAAARTVLEVRNLTRSHVIDDISFSIKEGEIVGLAGLVGSGRSEVARAIFGADRVDGGEIFVEGRRLRARGPRGAAGWGVVMVPESRKEQGLFMIRPIRENLVVSILSDVATLGVVRSRAERRRARDLAKQVDVRASSLEAPLRSLSGGNQQKVLFAKWLARRPRVLIADEPTRGVDVGAKSQIAELITKLAANGMGVLLISSEIEEVLGLSHRVLVMRSGRIVAEYDGEAATQDAVMRAAFAAVDVPSGGQVA
jgi:simple sugar transport system ATP-binding protein/ribose transport system ATP-binding protein